MPETGDSSGRRQTENRRPIRSGRASPPCSRKPNRPAKRRRPGSSERIRAWRERSAAGRS